MWRVIGAIALIIFLMTVISPWEAHADAFETTGNAEHSSSFRLWMLVPEFAVSYMGTFFASLIMTLSLPDWLELSNPCEQQRVGRYRSKFDPCVDENKELQRRTIRQTVHVTAASLVSAMSVYGVATFLGVDGNFKMSVLGAFIGSGFTSLTFFFGKTVCGNYHVACILYALAAPGIGAAFGFHWDDIFD
jgi:hypothetical protein